MRVAFAMLLVSLMSCADWDGLAKAARCKQAPESCADDAGHEASDGGHDGGMTGSSVWPDSLSAFCTDGVMEIAPCPTPGQQHYGQDGNYQINVPTYSEQGDVLHDSVTGLDWEENSSFNTMTQAQAIQHCRQLTTGGFTWRLPSRLELASLLDFGGGLPFSGVRPYEHWTSSVSGARGWVINFGDNTQGTYTATTPGFALCVTGPPLTGEVRVEAEVVVDSLTGLTWERTSEGNLSWGQALSRCELLPLAGLTDWRLPSTKELLTLVRDDEQQVAGLSGATALHWTSTPSTGTHANSNTVKLPGGGIGSDNSVTTLTARCVRGP